MSALPLALLRDLHRNLALLDPPFITAEELATFASVHERLLLLGDLAQAELKRRRARNHKGERSA